MKTHYVLIDYENVQPNTLSSLNGQPFKIVVFVGANQSKIPTEFADALQARGADGRYVRISGNGRNAVDFHISFYLADLASKDPEGHFHVVSKDTGFDPLLAHMSSRGLTAQRAPSLEDLALSGSDGRTADEKLEIVIEYLRVAGTARPRKRKTLANAINSQFGGRLPESEVEHLIAALERRGVVVTKDGAVSYKL